MKKIDLLGRSIFFAIKKESPPWKNSAGGVPIYINILYFARRMVAWGLELRFGFRLF